MMTTQTDYEVFFNGYYTIYTFLFFFSTGNATEMDSVAEKPYTVIKRIRGHQVCRRHIPRFLIRGEQIVLVATCYS